MKKLIFKALISLRELLDPAMEGDPYMPEWDYKSDRTNKSYRTYKTNKSNWSYFLNRYVLPRA